MPLARPLARPLLPYSRRPRRLGLLGCLGLLFAPARALAALAILVGALTEASPARAYVRARTDDTYIPLFWSDPRKVLQLAQPPAGIGITAAEMRGAAQAAVDSWSHSSIACTGVALSLARETTEDQTAGFDGINRIIMRTGAWCRDPVAMTHCHDPSVLALTTIFSRSHPGATRPRRRRFGGRPTMAR